MQTSVSQIIDLLFSKPPGKPGVYKVIIPSTGRPNSDEYNASIFPYLMSILIGGAKRLFGEEITPAQMSESQFDLLKKYMLSIGYQVKHEYKFIEPESTIPGIINIWFEPYSPLIDCHGRTIV